MHLWFIHFFKYIFIWIENIIQHKSKRLIQTTQERKYTQACELFAPNVGLLKSREQTDLSFIVNKTTKSSLTVAMDLGWPCYNIF